MTAVADVMLWGSKIGTVALRDGEDYARFEYAPEFAPSGIEVSPIVMPLSSRVYAFPSLRLESFHGLPGLLADSLPDKFGNAVIDSWLASQGRKPGSLNAVERLCYTGARGMGALEFVPAVGPDASENDIVYVDELVALASHILTQRESLKFSEEEHAMSQILKVGTSAGGARAKAVIAWNRETGEIRSGQASCGEGFEHWLIKFDDVAGNRDKEALDAPQYTRIEYGYHLMAKAAGIDMQECRLHEENGRAHFMTKRFDRTPSGGKLHMQTLGAIAHFDFNDPVSYSYEQAVQVMRKLALGQDEVEQLFARMVFNVVARNQDDHVKNIAFLMDKAGRWSLSDAYDVTYAYNPGGAWTGKHQMSVNGKRDGIARDDVITCAEAMNIKQRKANAIIQRVQEAAWEWPGFASEAGLSEETAVAIEQTFVSL